MISVIRVNHCKEQCWQRSYCMKKHRTCLICHKRVLISFCLSSVLNVPVAHSVSSWSPFCLPGWSWADVVVLVLVLSPGLSGCMLGLSPLFMLSRAISWSYCHDLALPAAFRSVRLWSGWCGHCLGSGFPWFLVCLSCGEALYNYTGH